MRQSQLFLPTMREVPSDAEAISHQLMLRAGMIRPLAAGIYSYMPLGRRVLRKIENIIREEMDAAGAQEMLMPSMQPTELWQESGRYSIYGPELMRLHDRHGREFALGPTAEEVVTSIVRNEINTYRKLPLILYQIQTKYRDERRPRFGLLRGREFLMKDAYSFDVDMEGLDQSYRMMSSAYHRIFDRLGIQVRAVEADAGAIGGEGGTQEFMALADIGEDTIASCDHCDYAANLKRAVAREGQMAPVNQHDPASREPERFYTPGIHTIDQLVQQLQLDAKKLIKTLIYRAGDSAIAVLVRGDHEVNDIKLMHALGLEQMELADSATVERITGAPVGFAGPLGLSVPIYVDLAVAGMRDAVVGGNEQDYHIRHVQPGRDFALHHVLDLRNVVAGDGCSRCDGGHLRFSRGIEVGQIFKLGTRYSEKMRATFLDANGREQKMMMGCYGIGVSRILSSVIEQRHDDQGILWPDSIAPYRIHIVPISTQDSVQMSLAESIYQRLSAAGMEVLIDDRDERPGTKFKDSDLIGIPYRIVIGKHAAEGKVELKHRGRKESEILGVEELFARIVGPSKGEER
ncbi:proline--tRNA ligase [Paenibacillus guangzhouensis]|uniref:proline--tRNA ligase n=1 Tax=Paenibacillus guangzhouensis TaxID=1473112 RepID=UPI0012668EB4|nr:proline--tRNA ligase [Paenibacillus guangzhouensis]